MKRKNLVACLAATVAVAAHATTPAADPASYMRVDDVPVLPTSRLLYRPVVIADEHLLELQGAELTPEGRADFKARRDAFIRSSGAVSRGPGRADSPVDAVAVVIHCVLVAGPLCPLAALGGLALGATVEGTRNAARRQKAANRAPSLLIPETHAARLAAMFEERATATVLADRVAAIAAPEEFESANWRQGVLIVHLQSVELSRVRSNWVGMRLTAQARAIAPGGAVSEPTRHNVDWEHGPLGREWTAGDNTIVQEALDQAIAALAYDITAVHARTWKASEEDALPPHASEELDADKGVKRSVADPSLLILSNATSLPAPGDTWTYRLTKAKEQPQFIQVSIVSANPELIVEKSVTGAVVETRHPRGGYLTRENDVLTFSPYLLAFGPVSNEATMVLDLKGREQELCGTGVSCSARALVVGREIVRLAGGDIEGTRVDVEYKWRGPFMRGFRTRTLTVWYASEIKRVVKVSSRGPGGVWEYDLELEHYEVAGRS